MSRSTRNLVLLFVLLTAFLLAPAMVAAGVTPTPEPTATPKPTPVVDAPGADDDEDSGGDGEDCRHRLLINITGCPPADLAISSWAGFDETDYAAGSGDKQFDEAWTGTVLDMGFDSGVPYRVFAWSDTGSWVYLFDFESSACGDQYASYDFSCAAVTATLTATLEASPTATIAPTPTALPVAELPETGAQSGSGWWPWALAGAVALLAALRWRKLSALTK